MGPDGGRNGRETVCFDQHRFHGPNLCGQSMDFSVQIFHCPSPYSATEEA